MFLKGTDSQKVLIRNQIGMLSFGFVDLEGEGPGFTVRHDLITSIFFHFEVFGEQVRDVLTGGLARLFPGFGDLLMQVEVNLSTEVLSGWHGGHSFPLIVTQVYPKGMANAITTTTKEWQTDEAKPPKGTAVEWVSPQAFVFLIFLDVFSWQPGAGRRNEKRP